MFTENGFSNPLWFVGIVEDNVDPLNQGRVRVRCFGLHPPYNTGELPTSDLPWAAPINGSYGGTAQIPRVADWVVGFFPDGRDAQHPFIFGTLPGQNLMAMSGSGVENESAYMRPSTEARRFYGKPPLPPAQGGENLEDTQLVIQDAHLKTGVPIADDGLPEQHKEKRGWSETASSVSAAGAKTTVFKSMYSDSYIEICGEERNEFINISHATGSQVQIDEQGTIKIKSLGDRHDITEKNVREWNSGQRDIFVDGNYTIKVQNGNCTLEVDGNLNHVVHGDYNLNVGGRMAVSVKQGIEMAASRISAEAVAESINLKASYGIRMQADDQIGINGKSVMISGGNAAINAERIDFNTSIEEIKSEIDECRPSDLSMLPQVPKPVDSRVSIYGNQSGLETKDPNTDGAQIGNPNSSSGTSSDSITATDTILPTSPIV